MTRGGRSLGRPAGGDPTSPQVVRGS